MISRYPAGIALQQINHKQDPFSQHRLALYPLLRDKRSIDLDEILRKIELIGPEQFLAFLRWNSLAPLWYDLIASHGRHSAMGTRLMEQLHRDKLSTVAAYLLQKHTLSRLHQLLTEHDIPYAVFKGAQVRELVYPEPAIRPVCDIDVLVSSAMRDRVIKVLTDAGMSMVVKPENVSHECTLMDGNIAVDLHWHILRPGRMRVNMTDTLMQERQWTNGFYSLNDHATLFAMLVHPAFAKYVCSPYAILIRMVDLVFWLENRPVGREQLLDLLIKARSRTAAWTTLFWLNLIEENKSSQEIMQEIAPSTLQEKYLKCWITRNLPTKFLRHRNFIRLAFTLALHDSGRDALHAAFRLAHEMRRKQSGDVIY